MTKGTFDRFLLAVAPGLLAFIMRIWFGSCKVRVHNQENFFPPEETKENTVIGSFWHYSIIYLFYFMRKYRVTAMVSASRDGEYIARLAQKLGFNTVRGSRNRRGVEALKSLLRVVKKKESCAIVADGSQGPPRVLQPGALLLASKSGAPIIPMGWSASSYYTIKSWDRTVIPKPFSTIDIFFGEPLLVPARIKSDELEKFRLLLEERLNDIYKKSWEVYNKKSH